MIHVAQPVTRSSGQPRWSLRIDGYRLSQAAWRLDVGIHEAMVTCATSTVRRLQEMIRRAIDDDDRVAAMLDWPPTVRPSDAWGCVPDVKLGCHRCDMIFAQGRWHIIEINLMNAGGWIVPRLYRDVVDREAPGQTDPAALLLDHIVGASGARPGDTGLLVLLRQQPGEEFGDRFIARCREAIGGGRPGWALAYADWHDLTFRTAGVFLKTRQVNAILELEVAASLKRIQAQHLAAKNRLVLVAGPSARLANDKRWLVYLAAEPGSPVAPTLALGSLASGAPPFPHGLSAHVIEDRVRIVLKKARSDGGSDVFAGRSCAPAPWRALIDRAADDGDWVAQSWLEPERPAGTAHGDALPSDAHLIFSPFVIAGQYAGGFVRILRADGYDGARPTSAAAVSMAETQNGDDLVPLFPIFAPPAEQRLHG